MDIRTNILDKMKIKYGRTMLDEHSVVWFREEELERTRRTCAELRSENALKDELITTLTAELKASLSPVIL